MVVDCSGNIILLRRAICGLFALFLLAACDQQALIAQATPADVLEKANWFFDRVRKGDLAALESVTDVQGLSNEDRRVALQQMIDAMPRTEPQSSQVLGVTHSYQVNKQRTELVIEYRIGTPSVLAQLELERWTGHELRVTAATFEILPTSYDEMNAFTLKGKPLFNYVILAGNVLLLAFVLGTCVYIARRSNLRWKWLWCILSVLVASRLELNWTTNEWQFQLLYFGIPVRLDQIGSGPWTFKLFCPIGALIFWIFRPGGKPKTPVTEVTVFD